MLVSRPEVSNVAGGDIELAPRPTERLGEGFHRTGDHSRLPKPTGKKLRIKYSVIDDDLLAGGDISNTRKQRLELRLSPDHVISDSMNGAGLQGILRHGSTRLSRTVRPVSSTIAISTMVSPTVALNPVVSVSR